MNIKDTEEARIYLAKKARADQLFVYAKDNPAWTEVALDAEEDCAIFAYEFENKIFVESPDYTIEL